MNRLAAQLADRYRVEGEIGRGGMGLVYRAHDLALRAGCEPGLDSARAQLAALVGR